MLVCRVEDHFLGVWPFASILMHYQILGLRLSHTGIFLQFQTGAWRFVTWHCSMLFRMLRICTVLQIWWHISRFHCKRGVICLCRCFGIRWFCQTNRSCRNVVTQIQDFCTVSMLLIFLIEYGAVIGLHLEQDSFLGVDFLVVILRWRYRFRGLMLFLECLVMSFDIMLVQAKNMETRLLLVGALIL